MRLSHINITMPKGGEEIARSFYAGLLGLKEIPKPESIRNPGGVWFESGGLDVHVSVEENRNGPDALRHFGLECDKHGRAARKADRSQRRHRGRSPNALAAFFYPRPFRKSTGNSRKRRF